MTLADDLIPIAYELRGIAGSLGFRPHTVLHRVKYWSGQHVGEGQCNIVDTPIVEGGGHPPKVRVMKTEEIALGQLPAGTLEVGAITPEFSGGGTPDALFTDTLPVNASACIVLTGPQFPNGAELDIVERTADRALRRLIRVANPKPIL